MSSAVAQSARDHDLVLWGATGFTGTLVAEHLAQHYPPGTGLRWAIAGRSRERLAALAARLGQRLPILLGDSHDRASLDRIAAASRAVISTVGPYALHGDELVAACAAAGTHYCDLAGEPQWMRRMLDAHQATAERSGAVLVPACGFDSIPSDLGTWFLQRAAVARGGRACSQVHMRVRAARGGVSGGTIASAMQAAREAAADRAIARLLADPFALCPQAAARRRPPAPPRGVHFDRELGCWTAPFVMAVVNTRIVYRSHCLLGDPWGEDFAYDEAVLTGKGASGWLRAVAMSAGLGAFMLANSMAWSRRLLARWLPKPGEGPDAAARAAGHFCLWFYGRLPDGALLRCEVRGEGDPGYAATSRMLGEAGACLAQDALPAGGGFWTPASALAEPLLTRLQQRAGMRFAVLDAGG